ncbi:MAG TPA: hypothetical protein VLT92_19575, partial [Burkholderiales bacterium]|nr:hypothetical protein [Burkholderiales bacterium]
AVGVLALQARRTGSIAALLLGIVASAAVLAGKFHFESDWLTTGGIVLLIIAILFGNRSRSNATAACPACVAGGNEQQVKAH